MQAIVLAAGEGTRLRPLTRTTPKPMLPVADRPLAAHVAETAVEAGATELVFVVGYRREQVEAYFGDSFMGAPVRYAVQEEQAGTADAVAAAREHLEGPFAVLNGDNVYDPAGIAELFDAAPSLAVHRVEAPSNYGVVATDGGTVTGIVEKPERPASDMINAGAYVFPEEAREYLDVPESERGERELTDVLARVIDEHEVRPVTIGRWMDVGRPWELLEANERALADLERSVEGRVHEDATLRGDVVVEEGATVDAGVIVEGPVLVRSGASVGPNAYVRGSTVIGRDAHVGHSVEVKNSVLMEGATVPHLSYVGDSLLGRDVNLGAGTNVANLRHDDEPVRQTVKGERVSTGRRKFGVVAGDGVKTGIDTSIYPGVCLSPGARTRPGEVVDRDR